MNSKCAAHQLGGHVQSKPQFLICVRRPAALPSKRLGLNGIPCQEPRIQPRPSLQPRPFLSHAPPFSHALPSVWLPDPAPGFSVPAWQAGRLLLAAGGTALGSVLGASLSLLLCVPRNSQIPCGRNKKRPPLSPCTGLLEALPSGVKRTSRLGERKKGNFLLLVVQS